MYQRVCTCMLSISGLTHSLRRVVGEIHVFKGYWSSGRRVMSCRLWGRGFCRRGWQLARTVDAMW